MSRSYSIHKTKRVRSYIVKDQFLFYLPYSKKSRLSGALISIRPMLCNAPLNLSFLELPLKKTFWSLAI